MKNSFRLAEALAVLVVLIACSQLHDSQELIDSTVDRIRTSNRLVFTAKQEGDEHATRTVLDSDGAHVLWMPGDEISIFHEGSDPALFRCIDKQNVAIATFEGEITTRVITGGNEGSDLNAKYYWGLYPYDANASYADGLITTSLPSEQTAVAGSFDDDLFITIGRSETTEMPFFNVCSGIKFTLDRDDIRSVTLTADGGQALAGTFSVGFDDETGKPVVKEILDGESTITLTPAGAGECFQKETWYYFITLPQTLENEGGFTFTFTLQDINGGAPVRMRSTAPLTLNRSAFRKSEMKIATTIDTDIETADIRSFLEDPEIDALYSTDMEYSETKGSGISCAASPVRFNWSAMGERTLYISTKDDFSDATKVAVESSATSTSVYNLIPDVTYYCRTVSASGTTYWETSFMPVGPFRALQVNGAGNARDLGGWTTQDGYKVRYGKVFRGKAPSASSSELLNLGVDVEMDLRGYPATSGSPNSSCPFGAEFINRPVCQFMYGESSHLPGTSADDYQQAIREIIDCLSKGKGVYFHCIGGADRTGTLSYLILALLGVKEADLCKEYELTGGRTRDDNGTRPFKQLVFYLKTFTEFMDPDTGEILEAKNLQDMAAFWAMTRHSDEDDGLGPFEPLSREDIDTLKTLLLEGYAR